MTSSPEFQQTLRRPASCRGTSLHGGQKITLTLKPAPAGYGIVFRRLDRSGEDIPASWRLAQDRPLCTTLSRDDGLSVRTTEHLMCALYACGVDNALVELSGDEPPILDGSAAPYVELISDAGVETQGTPRRFIEILKPVEFRHPKKTKSVIRAEPAAAFHLTVVLGIPGFGRMQWSGPATREQVKREIAAARTFGPLEGAVPVMLAGRLGGPRLLRGASPRNAIVFWKGRVLNPGGLRFPDEFVRHHTLDAIGDLSLAGAPIRAAITAEHTRHGFTQLFLKQLMQDETAWRWA